MLLLDLWNQLFRRFSSDSFPKVLDPVVAKDCKTGK